MPSLVVCIRRKPELTLNEFDHHWKAVHGPLLRGCANFARHLRRYSQYHLSELSGSTNSLFGNSGGFDGVAVLEFDTVDAMEAAFAEPDYLSQVKPDEKRFVDLENCLSFLTERFDVIVN